MLVQVGAVLLETITVSAPMTGRMIEVLVSEGDTVSNGDVLVVIESMKMENEILSQNDGRVATVHVNESQTITEGDAILDIEVA